MRHSPETIARARQQYAEGGLVARICRDNEMSKDTLYYWVDGGPAHGEQRLPPLPRRRGGFARRRRRLSGDRVSLVRRLWRTAESQVRDIEDRLAAIEQEPAERERDARMLAVLVKTLRELTALDAASGAGKPPRESESEDDEIPRDMDEFRRELARRMEAFVRDRLERGISGDADAE